MAGRQAALEGDKEAAFLLLGLRSSAGKQMLRGATTTVNALPGSATRGGEKEAGDSAPTSKAKGKLEQGSHKSMQACSDMWKTEGFALSLEPVLIRLRDKDTEQPLNSGDASLAHKALASKEAFKRIGIPVIAAVLSIAILATAIFLIKMAVDSYYFFCGQTFQFIPLSLQCDGRVDCAWGEDEAGCVQQVPDGPLVAVRLSRDRSSLQVRDKETGGWAWVCHGTAFDMAMATAACKQMGYSRVPSFRAVAIGAAQQGQPLREVILQGGELRWRDSERQCLSGLIVSLSCSSCGYNLRSPRVVGGSPASIETWPWQASLQHKGQHACGGSIIDPQWVVTAAHCFRNHLVTKHWKVEGGSETLSSATAVPVEKVFVIDIKYMFPKDMDIALVKLQSPLGFPESVKPICLPFFDEEIVPGTPLWITGWGYTKQDGMLSKKLQQAEVELIDSRICNTPDAYQGEVTEKMLCAGGDQGRADTCQGDSGGPLMFQQGQWHLVGIVSWGHGCGSPSTPGVYTKVQAYLNWIYTILRSES
ncbi:transmembrane protease serine 4 [Rhineura floridana]|uniref:transmembrane protease serine 4 n=1 Tax=Rhineura floridana TaxID=261503 RepID=UPI002AC83C77|nr:transmembrane protease serine 4 [Rhineura floridana]